MSSVRLTIRRISRWTSRAGTWDGDYCQYWIESFSIGDGAICRRAALCGGLLGASRVAVSVIIAGGLVSGLFLCAIGLFLVASIKSGNEIHGVSLFGSGTGLSIVLGEGILGALILVLFPIAPLFVAGFRRRRLYAVTTLILVGACVESVEWRFFGEKFGQSFRVASYFGLCHL